MNEYKPPEVVDPLEVVQKPKAISMVDAIARVAICLFALYVLWMPFCTIFGHPYFFQSWGILGYYVYASGLDNVIRNEIRFVPLAITVALSALATWFGYIGFKRLGKLIRYESPASRARRRLR